MDDRNISRLPNLLMLALLIGLAGCAQETKLDEVEPALIQQSEALADRFQSELKGELSQALRTVGPIGAVGVCQAAAPAIAQKLSSESGARVSRIARRNRNAEGALTSDIEALYGKLEASPMADGKPRAVHANIDGRTVYLRAIPMQEQPCSACHGTNIDPELKSAITNAYPQDRATGFKPGELRGAFMIEHLAQP